MEEAYPLRSLTYSARRRIIKPPYDFFLQCAVTWMLRIIDVLFDDGDLFEDYPEFSELRILNSVLSNEGTQPVFDILKLLQDISLKKGSLNAESPVIK